jgi:hypothetical protein
VRRIKRVEDIAERDVIERCRRGHDLVIAGLDVGVADAGYGIGASEPASSRPRFAPPSGG